MGAAYGVIKKNTSHPVLKLWTDNCEGEKISLYCARSETDEALFIVNEIARYLAIGNSYKLSNFAVLFRTNAQSRVLEEAFLHSGVPYILVGGVRFYERKEIKDCLCFLRLVINPKDAVSYKRIEKLGKRRLLKFLSISEKIDRSSATSLQILDEILEETRYFDLYDAKDLEDLARLENIKELRSVASEFPVLTAFLENVALIEREYLAIDEVEIGKERKKKGVTLMTVHAAKGTEFPVVFMVGMEEGLFPHLRSILEKEGIEEERRLCYVGITRAKSKLYLSYASHRLYFGQHSVNPASRFLLDIPERFIERVAETNIF